MRGIWSLCAFVGPTCCLILFSPFLGGGGGGGGGEGRLIVIITCNWPVGDLISSLLSFSDNKSPLSELKSLNIPSKTSSILFLIPMHMLFSLFLVSAKSADITNIFVKFYF